MLIYLRNINTFSVMAMYECGDWSISLDLRSRSNFTVPAELYDVEGQLVCCYDCGVQQGYVGVITGLRLSNGTTTIQAAPLTTLFDSDYELTRDSIDDYATGCNGCIYETITVNHISTADAVFKYPWLTVYYNADTKKAPPELNNAGLFNLTQYIDDRIKAGDTQCEIWLNNNGVSMAFGTGKKSAYIYDFTTGRHQLIREAYSASVTARITTHNSDDAEPPTWTTENYYLLDDGTYTTSSAAANRVRGSWRHLYNAESTDVDDEFKKNEYKADVEFYTRELPPIFFDYQLATIKLQNGRIINTVITQIQKSSSDDRFKITTGIVVTNTRAYLAAAYNTARKAAADVAVIRRT